MPKPVEVTSLVHTLCPSCNQSNLHHCYKPAWRAQWFFCEQCSARFKELPKEATEAA